MIQNILALIIVFLAAGISIYSVIRSLTSKKGAHCDGCAACGANSSNKSKTTAINNKNINYKNLIFDNKGK
jgi:hypothetical protein